MKDNSVPEGVSSTAAGVETELGKLGAGLATTHVLQKTLKECPWPEDTCIHCGRPEADHHAFVAIQGPKGCNCNPKEWGNPSAIPAICGQYVDEDGLCRNCEHERECHSASEADSVVSGTENVCAAPGKPK